MTNDNIAIRVQNVSKDFGQERMLKSVAPDFESHSIVGNNDSGKTAS